MNERTLSHLCGHIDYTGPWKHQDGERNQMTMSSRHRIRNSSPAGVLARFLLVTGHPHPTESLQVSGEETFCSLKFRSRGGTRQL